MTLLTSYLILYYRKHRFDGLDLDWEYPANRGGVPADKENFVSLVKVGDSFMELDLFIFLCINNFDSYKNLSIFGT